MVISKDLLYIKWSHALCDLEVYTEYQLDKGVTDKEISEKFTVGFMIELLSNAYGDIIIHQLDDSFWNVSAVLVPCLWEYEIDIKGKELCDVLWEIVTMYLEDNYLY